MQYHLYYYTNIYYIFLYNDLLFEVFNVITEGRELDVFRAEGCQIGYGLYFFRVFYPRYVCY